MKAYAILYDGKISSGGYTDVREAIAYCDERGIQQIGWNWIDEHKRLYQIVEIDIRENPQLKELKDALIIEHDMVSKRMDKLGVDNTERWLNLSHYRTGLRFAIDGIEDLTRRR